MKLGSLLRTGLTAGAVLAVTVAGQAVPANAGPATPANAVLAAAPDISVSNVLAHLNRLQSIARQNGGNRSASGGYQASVSYVEQQLAAVGFTTRRQTCTSCAGQPQNLIADWPGGDPSRVIMLGAHLDSVRSGPGINDNGTGSAAILEVALTLAQTDPQLAKHVRFGWWADEESGLRGSQYYVNNLPGADRSAIDTYLNFDMVGSRNWGYFVYDNVASIKAIFDGYFQAIGISTAPDTEGDGRSDHSSFERYGIPVGGLFTGAGATKTSAQQRMWGGTAGRPFDSCYHSACDTTANVASTPLNNNSDAIAFALWELAVTDEPPPADNDFSLAVNPASATVEPGQSATTTLTTTLTEGNTQTIDLRATGLPTGATATFAPATIQTGDNATLTITTTAGTPNGTTQVTITGDGAEIDHTVQFTLTVGTGNPPGCDAPAWNASTSYQPGDLVSHNTHEWESTWYSTGAEPGAPSSWAVWRDLGAC